MSGNNRNQSHNPSRSSTVLRRRAAKRQIEITGDNSDFISSAQAPLSSSPQESSRKKSKKLQPAPAVLIESPVPGVNIELASLLVKAVKTRRKYFSKSSPTPATGTGTAAASDAGAQGQDDSNSKIHEALSNAADDATTSFLNELRRNIEQWTKSTQQNAQQLNFSRKKNPNALNPCANCLSFLKDVFSDGDNSFHLRRSALFLTREVLIRSRHGRAYLVGDRHLLQFIEMIEDIGNADNEEEEEGSQREDEEAVGQTPKDLFQQEAIDLIHNLAMNYGQLYPQFMVASRLLGDVAVELSVQRGIQNMAPIAADSGDGSNEGARQTGNRGKQLNMKTLRRVRNIALEHGPKACQSLERMLERADSYFSILVPRFGGLVEAERKENGTEFSNSGKSDELSLKMPVGTDQGIAKKEAVREIKTNEVLDQHINDEHNRNSQTNASIENIVGDGNSEIDEEDGDSIDWEEGDLEFSDNDENDIDMNRDDTADTPTNHSSQPALDHEAAVERTLAIMDRSGALLEGQLSISIGETLETEPSEPVSTAAAKTPFASDGNSTIITRVTNSEDPNIKARIQLQNIINKLQSKWIPRLKQWIFALSHADGMEERAVADPVSALRQSSGGDSVVHGPVSLVLLSEEMRNLRGPLLQRMMKAKQDIKEVLKLGKRLGVVSEGYQKSKFGEADAVKESSGRKEIQSTTTSQKRIWLPGVMIAGDLNHNVRRRRERTSKKSRLRVIYRDK